MIDLSGTQPAPPERAMALWQRCAHEASASSDLWRIPTVARGDEILREELGKQLGLEPELLTITASVRAAALTYARAGRHIIVERPTFAGCVEVLNGSRTTVDLRPWDEILSGDLPKDATLWVTSPARNPDGRTLDSQECARLAARVAGGHPVVVNETYRWFHRRAPRVAGADLVGSLHKLVGMESRIGWVYSQSFCDDAFIELLGTSPPRVWQRAWGLFLRRGGMDELHSSIVHPALHAARAFSARFKELTDVPADFDAPSMLLHIAGSDTEDDTVTALNQLGYLVSPGRYFLAALRSVRATFLGVTVEDALAFADVAAGLNFFAGIR